MRLLPLLLLSCACAPSAPELLSIEVPPLDGEGVFRVAGSDPERPRLRYRDGQVSLNDACAIRLTNRLSPRIPPMYVNGAPVGFC